MFYTSRAVRPSVLPRFHLQTKYRVHDILFVSELTLLRKQGKTDGRTARDV